MTTFVNLDNELISQVAENVEFDLDDELASLVAKNVVCNNELTSSAVKDVVSEGMNEFSNKSINARRLLRCSSFLGWPFQHWVGGLINQPTHLRDQAHIQFQRRDLEFL